MTEDIELIDSTQPPVVAPTELVTERSWMAIALVVGMAVLAALVLTYDGDDESGVPPSATTPRAERMVDVTAGVEVGDGPVLGRVSGLSLMVGGSGTPLQVLDLDSGDRVISNTILGPKFIAGSTLIYLSDTLTWSYVPLDGLRSSTLDDIIGIRFAPIGGPARVVPATEFEVWLTWPTTDGARRWQLIELATSNVLRDIGTPVEARFPGGTDPFVGPEVIGSETGGVFELQPDDSYRQVLPGVLIAVGESEVLVRQCSDSLECSTAWFDRRTWTRTDTPIPSADLSIGRVVAGGRLLAGSVPQPALGGGLYDIATGEIVRSLGPASIGAAAVSPDGAWFVRRLLGRIEVVEVGTGTSTVVLNLSIGRGDSIVWLENDR